MQRTQSLQTLVTAGIRYRLAILQKSQYWLADHIGMSTYALSRRMVGKKTFSVDEVDTVAAALGTDFEGLIALPQDSYKQLS